MLSLHLRFQTAFRDIDTLLGQREVGILLQCGPCKALCALTTKVRWLSAERLMHSGDVESSTDLVSAQLTASTLSKLSGAGFKLFWGGTGGNLSGCTLS